jgi:hypothetical protein
MAASSRVSSLPSTLTLRSMVHFKTSNPKLVFSFKRDHLMPLCVLRRFILFAKCSNLMKPVVKFEPGAPRKTNRKPPTAEILKHVSSFSAIAFLHIPVTTAGFRPRSDATHHNIPRAAIMFGSTLCACLSLSFISGAFLYLFYPD